MSKNFTHKSLPKDKPSFFEYLINSSKRITPALSNICNSFPLMFPSLPFDSNTYRLFRKKGLSSKNKKGEWKHSHKTSFKKYGEIFLLFIPKKRSAIQLHPFRTIGFYLQELVELE